MGQLAIRNLSQTRIEGQIPSYGVGKIASLVILAAGAGSRRRHLLNLLKSQDAFSSRVIAVSNDVECAEGPAQRRPQVDVLSCPAACEVVRTIARGEDGVASVFVDLSCLAREHIGAIFSTIKQLANSGPVDLQIGYSLARFVKPPQHWSTAIRRIAPVNGDFAGWTAAPDKPIELVIALGYEKGKAIGAAEYLEPGDTWLFVPDSPEDKYLREVQIHNHELLQERQDKRLDYKVLSPVDAYHALLSLVLGMKNVARPILLPFGPKVFFGLSLLVAMVIEEAAVWFVDGENTSGTDMGQPSPHAVIMNCRVETIGS